MKMTVMISAFALICCAFGAIAPKELDIRPEATADRSPTAVEWQNTNGRALAAATASEELKKPLASSAAADSLLQGIAGAYRTDPVVAAKIAAVTQFVMTPGAAKGQRSVWVQALLRRMEDAEDPYVVEFCLEQLRWCAERKDAVRIRRLSAGTKNRGVCGFADMVATELEGRTE